MVKKEFIDFISKLIKSYGFEKNKSNFYFDFENDIVAVIGLEKSNFGEYYYIEYGFVFKSINKHLPYPKYFEANIRCRRIKYLDSTAIKYELINKEELLKILNAEIIMIKEVGIQGTKNIIDTYILTKSTKKYIAIIGYDTIKYLGISDNGITIHPGTV